MNERRRGRPPLDDADRSVPVHVKMPSRQYDDLYERAQRDRVSVPEVIRRALDKRNPK
jgi:hypothetical protein